jgi:hypothetical protein
VRIAVTHTATQIARQLFDDGMPAQCSHAKAATTPSSKISHITPQELHRRARFSITQAYGNACGVASERICINV